jgi:hypothetical protein
LDTRSEKTAPDRAAPWQFVEDVAQFIIATALLRLLSTEYFLDSGAQCFGSIDHEQILAVRSADRDRAKRVSKRLTEAAFSFGPGSIPRMCFLPPASTPTALMM